MGTNKFDWVVQYAGLENLSAFLENVSTMLNQEVDALKSSAAQGMGGYINCPRCNEIVDRVKCELIRTQPPDAPAYYFLVFNCPRCGEEQLSVRIVPESTYAETLPF